MEEGGIYIHIPFCRNKCLYCDFYSAGERIADWDIFCKTVISELKSRLKEIDFIPTTLYLGGGTPSLIPVEVFKRIISLLKSELGINEWKEFTIEVNPEDVCHEKCKVWREMGVNRVSVGIQTLNDSELKIIGRKHSSEDALKAFNLLHQYFDNISVDVMFGIPSQTPESYKTTLEKIIEFRPSHISSYSLMLEEGTAMTLLVKRGKLKLPQEDDWMKMFQLTKEKLQDAGYIRYEISNFALPGFESRHNTSYWLGKPYIGLGPGAHSFDGRNTRRANPNDIKGYIRNFDTDSRIFYTEETLSTEERREEMIMTRLRMADGLNIEEFEAEFGEKEKNRLLQNSKEYISRNLMKLIGKKLSFTDSGFEISDLILSNLF